VLAAAIAARDGALDPSGLRGPPPTPRPAGEAEAGQVAAGPGPVDGVVAPSGASGPVGAGVPPAAPVRRSEPSVRPPVTFDLARPSRPEGVVDSLRAVPDVTGLPTRAAVRVLHAAGFRVVLVGVGAGPSTSPAAGTLLPGGALVRLPSAR
ncbi:MAG: PASTA domain-containing protein, partial [Gemmatimonadota bacterium]